MSSGSSAALVPISLQIDPALFQQTLQQGGLLSQPLSVDTGLVSHSGGQLTSAADPSVSANVVIHPLTSLALQSSAITPAQVTMAALSEQDATGGCKVNSSENCYLEASVYDLCN